MLIYWHCQQSVAFWISNICILWWKNTVLQNVWLLLIAGIHLLSWLPKCERKCQGVHTPRSEFLWSVYQSQTLINNADTCQVLITPAPWAHLPLAGGCSWGALGMPASAGGFSALRSYGSSCTPLSWDVQSMPFHSQATAGNWLMLEKPSLLPSYPWVLTAVCIATLQGDFRLLPFTEGLTLQIVMQKCCSSPKGNREVPAKR